MGDGSRDPDRGGAGRDAPAAGHVLLGGHIARQGPAIRASVAGVAVAEGARVGRGKAVRAGRRTSTATSASATAASHQAPTSITVTCGCPICGADFLSTFAENKVLEFLFNPYCETSASLTPFAGFVARHVFLTTTLSPSAMRSSIVTRMSGNFFSAPPTYCFAPSGPGGVPGGTSAP